MDFIGAATTQKDLRTTSFTEFTDGAFNPSNDGTGQAVSKRQAPITAYRDALKNYRGFRG